MRAYYSENVSADALKQRPMEARLDAYHEMRTNLGSLELRRVISAGETSVEVLIRGTTDEWREMTILFTEDAEHKLQGIRVEDAERPRDSESQANTEPAVRLGAAELPKRVANYLDGLSKSDDFSGVVMIAHGRDVAFHSAYGMANKAFEAANREDTKFDLGSMCKAFTQIAIGQLIEQGKLHLEDHFGQFLPDYPNKDAAQKVTVRQLLDMTSGIGDFSDPNSQRLPKTRFAPFRIICRFLLASLSSSNLAQIVAIPMAPTSCSDCWWRSSPGKTISAMFASTFFSRPECVTRIGIRLTTLSPIALRATPARARKRQARKHAGPTFIFFRRVAVRPEEAIRPRPIF